MADGKVTFAIEGDSSAFEAELARLGKKANDAMSKAVKATSDPAKAASEGVGKAAGGMLSRISGSVREAAAKVKGSWGEALSGAAEQVKASPIGQAFSKVASGIGTVLSGVGGRVGAVMSTVGGALGKVASGIGTAFQAAKGVVSSVASHVSSVMGPVVDGIGGALGKVADVGGKALGAVAKAGAVAAGAVGSAIAAIGSQALSAYGQFEQLEGGSKLMFGEAYGYIEKRSKEAFRNVQMSQNDYLTQVNGLAVGLKTAMGGNAQAAAELADKVVTAEADVVAATGNTQENVQNAFNGIMKGNFTMLDNLQLGINPTKEGFQEVIDKVNEWNAANGEATSYQIDNLADCQSALVDYISMQGLAGYAANEGAQTIEGSMSKAKAAWTDWLTELGKSDADMRTATENLKESLVDVAGNVVERAATIASNLLGQLPGIVAEVGPVLKDALVEVLDGATGGAASQALATLAPLTDAVVSAFGGITGWIEANRPTLEDLGMKFGDIAGKVSGALGGAINAVMPVLGAMASAVLPVLSAGLDLVSGAIDGVIGFLTFLWEATEPVRTALGDTLGGVVLPALCDALGTVGDALSGLGDWFTSVAEGAQQAFQGLVDFLTPLLEGLGGVIGGIGDFIADPVGTISKGVGDICASFAGGQTNVSKSVSGIQSTVATGMGKVGTEMTRGGQNAASGLSGAISRGTTSVASSAHQVERAGEQPIEKMPAAFQKSGKQAGEGLASGISANASKVTEGAKGLSDAAEKATEDLPSKLEAKGKDAGGKYASGISSKKGDVSSAASSLSSAAAGMQNGDSYTWGSHLGGNFAAGIRSQAAAVAAASAQLAAAASSNIKHSTPKVGPLRHDDVWGEHLGQNIARGMARAAHLVREQSEGYAESIAAATGLYRATAPSSWQGAYAAQGMATARADVRHAGTVAGAASSPTARQLDQILSAVRAGHVIEMDAREMGRTVRRLS